MTITEAMAIMQMSRPTIFRMLKDKRLKNVAPYHPGKKRQPILLDRDQVLSYAPRPRSA